eukprot:6197913-Pleurochrysis_carterae.AAC.7
MAGLAYYLLLKIDVCAEDGKGETSPDIIGPRGSIVASPRTLNFWTLRGAVDEQTARRLMRLVSAEAGDEGSSWAAASKLHSPLRLASEPISVTFSARKVGCIENLPGLRFVPRAF